MDKFKLKVTQGYYTNGYVDQGAMALDKCACSCAKKESCIAFGWRDTFSTWNPEHCYFWENKADLNETVTDSMVNTYIKMGDLGKKTSCLCIYLSLRYKLQDPVLKKVY